MSKQAEAEHIYVRVGSGTPTIKLDVPIDWVMAYQLARQILHRVNEDGTPYDGEDDLSSVTVSDQNDNEMSFSDWLAASPLVESRYIVTASRGRR